MCTFFPYLSRGWGKKSCFDHNNLQAEVARFRDGFECYNNWLIMRDAFAKVLLVSLKCCTEKEEAEEAIRCHASSFWLHICHFSHMVSRKSILKYKGGKAGFCRRIRRPKTTSCSWDHHLPSTGNNSRFNLSLFVEWSNFTWGCYQGSAPSGARPMRKTVARHSGNAANWQKQKEVRSPESPDGK